MKTFYSLLLIALMGLCACSKENMTVENDWATVYPWLGKIMTKAEKGEYKDLSGKEAIVSIYVLDGESDEIYFALHYGTTGAMIDEIRDASGKLIKKNVKLNYKQLTPIYPFFNSSVTFEEYRQGIRKK